MGWCLGRWLHFDRIVRFGHENRRAFRADKTQMSFDGHLLKFCAGQRGMTMGADDSNHGSLLEYCNFIQLIA